MRKLLPAFKMLVLLSAGLHLSVRFLKFLLTGDELWLNYFSIINAGAFWPALEKPENFWFSVITAVTLLVVLYIVYNRTNGRLLKPHSSDHARTE